MGYHEGMRNNEHAWQHLEELRAIAKRNGLLLPCSFAAELLGVTRQRISKLLEMGKLTRVEINGQPCVTEKSVREYEAGDRRPGVTSERWYEMQSAKMPKMTKA